MQLLREQLSVPDDDDADGELNSPDDSLTAPDSGSRSPSLAGPSKTPLADSLTGGLTKHGKSAEQATPEPDAKEVVRAPTPFLSEADSSHDESDLTEPPDSDVSSTSDNEESEDSPPPRFQLRKRRRAMSMTPPPSNAKIPRR